MQDIKVVAQAGRRRKRNGKRNGTRVKKEEQHEMKNDGELVQSISTLKVEVVETERQADLMYKCVALHKSKPSLPAWDQLLSPTAI